MLRGVARGVTVAAIAVACSPTFAGASSAVARAGAASTVTASSGAFTTVIPAGFRHDSALDGGTINFQYAVVATGGGVHASNVTVLRAASGGVDAASYADAEITTAKRLFPAAHSFSKIRSLTVDRQPARVFGFINPLGGLVLHQRQIIVVHAGWVYVVTDTALSARFTASVTALHAITSAWHWNP